MSQACVPRPRVSQRDSPRDEREHTHMEGLGERDESQYRRFFGVIIK